MKEDRTILAIDDSATNNMLLESVLASKGYEVTVVKSAAAAAEVLKSRRVALILLDLYMPEVNGFTFLEQLKKDKDQSAIPVIVVSAANDTESKRITRELGAVDYIEKPIDLHEVLEKVNKYLPG